MTPHTDGRSNRAPPARPRRRFRAGPHSFLAAVLAGVAPLGGLSAQSTIVTDTVRSPGLATNVLGDPAFRRVLVYLPPSWRTEPQRHYPALYLLHGVTSVPDEWVDGTYQGFDLRVAMDSMVSAGSIPELIVVMPDANNRLEADWYANSPVMGDWEDFVARDLVAHVERQYRADARASQRALVGHSMGGFGALAIGFDHADVFGLVYAISPCCIGFVGRLAPANPAWLALSGLERWQDAPPQVRIHLSLAAALDGNPSSPRLFDALPFGSGPGGEPVAHPEVQARWLARMPPDLASAMVRRGDRQPVIFIEAGSGESDILAGIRLLRERLDSLGVRYSDTTFVGGHIDRVRERFTRHVLPAIGAWFMRGGRSRDARR